jgi:hypothetical protein
MGEGWCTGERDTVVNSASMWWVHNLLGGLEEEATKQYAECVCVGGGGVGLAEG